MDDSNKSSHGIPSVDAGRANDESVIRAHASIRRTPVAGSPVLFFTSVALIIVFVFGWFYLRRYTANWDSSSVLADREQIAALEESKANVGPALPEVFDGAKVYATNCAACHQANGQGLAGAFPPLAGSEWVKGDASVPVKIVLNGISGPITVAGTEYNSVMPGLGALKDGEIAAAVSYIRSSWDNGASEVTAEEVAVIRAEIGDRGMWTAAELQQ